MAVATRKRSLIDALASIVGPENVLHRPEDMVVFEYDASIGKHIPQAAVFPDTTEEVSRIVRLANELGVPVVPRGAGTGLSGGAVAPKGGLIIGLTRMTRFLEIDPINRIAVVEPGVVNQTLSEKTAGHGLHYAPDPSSQKICTIGGNVAENSGGPHCLAYGVTVNHVLGMEVVLPDGEVMWLGGKEQDRPGIDLPGVFVGSEGTLGIATKIVVKLMPNAEAVRTMVAVFDEMAQGSKAVSAIIAHGIVPAALEMIDALAIEAVTYNLDAGYMKGAGAVLLIEVDGLKEAVFEEEEAVLEICRGLGARALRVAETPADRAKLWAARKGAFGALGRLAPNYYILDGVVPRTKLSEVLVKVGDICDRYGFRIANVFHAGDGNLHPCVAFDERVPGESERVLEAGAEIMQVCVDVGGSITGEHGVGLEKKKFMSLIFSPNDLAAMEKVKEAFGVTDAFNPCKILPGGASCADGWRLLNLPNLGPDTSW